MDELIVRTAQNPYPIHIEDGFSCLAACLTQAGLRGRKICVMTDANVDVLYARAVTDVLRQAAGEVHRFVFEAGEKNKNLSTISDAYRFCLEKRLDRRSVIVALGGGVTGDMAGFTAATYMRGIDFIQVPTTLLAQVDSSVGGKVGVDFEGNKNLIGAFYQPRFVYINVRSLATLPGVEFASGMGEAVKHGLIGDADYLAFIKADKEKIKALDTEALTKLVYGSCRFKAGVVTRDEKESGLREILNFGHTFGHAIESLLNYSLPHGHCVAAGAVAALYLSAKTGRISMRDVEAAKKLFSFFGLPVCVTWLNAGDIFAQMRLDKKTKHNQIHLVLLEKIGRAYIDGDINDEDILWAISNIKGY